MKTEGEGHVMARNCGPFARTLSDQDRGLSVEGVQALITVSYLEKEVYPMKRWLKRIGSFLLHFVLHVALESFILSLVFA
jgi:hypothetical protein